MPDVLIAVLNMSIAGCTVIILAFLIRFLLRRVPKKYSYFLWGLVCVRLICPFGICFQSILNLLKGRDPGNLIRRTEYIPQSFAAVFLYPDKARAGFVATGLTILFIVWLIGFGAVLFYEISAYMRARKKLVTAIKVRDNIFETDQITSPFIFALFRPRIYLPLNMSEKELKYVLCHESIHIQRKDYLIKLIACFVLAFHWFNPFVWLAFKYMSMDMEMSCDEKVVASLGNSHRKEYAQVIFRFSKAGLPVTKSMLTFGASDTRVRIKNILKKKKSTKIGIAITAVVCVTLVIGLLSNSAVGTLFGAAGDTIYISEVKRLGHTNLSGIRIDGIKIGASIADIDLTQYTAEYPNTTGDYNYFFDQLRIGVDAAQKVTAVTASSEYVKINGNTGLNDIDAITQLLGNTYLDKPQDREQQLQKRVYYDSSENVIAEFIYAAPTGDFAWVVLKKSV